jgi:hypothetical protein
MHVISCVFINNSLPLLYVLPALPCLERHLERFPFNVANIAPIEFQSQFAMPQNRAQVFVDIGEKRGHHDLVTFPKRDTWHEIIDLFDDGGGLVVASASGGRRRRFPLA